MSVYLVLDKVFSNFQTEAPLAMFILLSIMVAGKACGLGQVGNAEALQEMTCKGNFRRGKTQFGTGY
jgi:hypothetical protein